ncbi:hypothetical protein SBV1_1210002 [Verrucomicrobia bacterium]|nr:hypothetical protein SBV1_1210002 [Verrucomicrobiota bacterium]
MPLSYAELEQFYEGLVSRARSRGITCAITSGMACVAFGVAQATKDCDLLCVPDAAGDFFKLLGEADLGGQMPSYRGHLTAPLDSRWLRGGWTSHFVWDTPGVEAYLDIFGVAPRGSSPWEAELQGFYAGPHIVAEMKRTNREKDWPFATALGVKLLETGDPRGWLHLFNYDVLVQTARKLCCPAAMVALRPALALLIEADERLEFALKGEIEFWNRLDRLRLEVYGRAVRPYMLAVKADHRSSAPSLAGQHQARLEHAEQLLPVSPLRQYGIQRLIDEAQAQAARFLPPGALRWLPDAGKCFNLLAE